MQTFLPLPSFEESARVLDNKRLGSQRNEAYVLIKTLFGQSKGWANHPACKMWKGYERALVEYGLVICKEYQSRGYNDTVHDKILEFLDKSQNITLPPWFGSTDFHLSHKSNLIRKNPEYYSPFWPDVPNDLEYVWPSKQKQ